MTTTTQPAAQTAAPAARRDPQPPSESEDRTRWRTVGRGRGIPQPPPLVSVQADFDRPQSDWLTEECRRTGLDYVSLVKKLVDEARTHGRRER